MIYLSYTQYQTIKDENKLYKDINLTSQNALDNSTLLLLGNLIERKQESNTEQTMKWLLWIGILALVIFIIYLLLNNEPEDKPKHIKQPVPVDKATSLFITNLIGRYKLPWVSIDGKTKQLKNENTIEVIDQRIHYHNSGERFLLLDFKVMEGAWAGLHTANIPIDKGEKAIESGEYNISHNKHIESYETHPQKYPFASVQDKRERGELLAIETLKQNNENDNATRLKEAQMKQQQSMLGGSPQYDQFGLSTPFDNYGQDTNMDNPDLNAEQPQSTGFSRYIPRRKPKKKAVSRRQSYYPQR
ncbi:hypothetical protein DRQ25_12425 [Candidatus Fermentibacteria bacterium]|nr:MAG: hypothetical protein DRQ25_12425 [Candidatus Fermentibacteria bacterium]